MPKKCAFILLILLSVYTFGAAQTKPSPTVNKPQDDGPLRIETELVQIDVVVTDKQGRPVRDLKREDFALYEDKRPQQITYFSVGSVARPARFLNAEKAAPNAAAKQPEPTPTTVEAAIGRYLVLAVDDIHLAPGNLMFARQALLRFLDKQMTSGDQVALITTSGQFGLYQQFTSDREALRRAINRLNVQERSLTNHSDIPRLTPYQAELIENNDPDALELAVRELMSRMQMTRQMAVGEAQSKARMMTAESVNFTMQTLSTLENVIRGLRPLPGRKAMVLLSDGFLLGGFNQGRQFDLHRITDAATRAGVVIYSLDARGLVAGPSSMDASQPGFGIEIPPGARSRIENASITAQQDGMFTLARETGGLPLFNSNDLNLGLQRVLDDTESYYLLAFEPTSSYRDGRFRKLEVKIPGRPDLVVRTRNGYFAPNDKAAAKAAAKADSTKAKADDKPRSAEQAAKDAKNAKETQMRAAWGSLFALRGIPTEMQAGFAYVQPAGSVVVINSHLDAGTLNFTEKGDRSQTTIEISGVIFDEKGKSAGDFIERVDMNLRPATLAETRRYGLTFHKVVPVKPGYYQVRLAVREEGSPLLGSASAWVEVPDVTQPHLSLSSIFIAPADVPQPAQAQGAKADDKAPLSAPGSLRFKRGAKFDFSIIAYNPLLNAEGASDLTVQTQVLAGGKTVLATPVTKISGQTAPNAASAAPPTKTPNAVSAQAAANVPTGPPKAANAPPNASNAAPNAAPLKAVPYLARLSTDNFSPGAYELRVLIFDRVARVNATRSIVFTVE